MDFWLFEKQPISVKIYAGPFRGATMMLIPAHSKRKIFGIYEWVNNSWINKAIKQVTTVIDVGANDGYFTYGCAHVIRKHRGICNVFAIEPELAGLPQLTIPSSWPEYSNIKFTFISKYAGTSCDERYITVAQLRHNKLSDKENALIKVDVEGAEVDVLNGAGMMLRKPNHWLVEVHGEHLIQPVLDLFKSASRQVFVSENKPHWLFGPEKRSINTYWVKTAI